MESKTKNQSRREFLLRTGTAAAGISLGAATVSAASYSRILGANDRIRVGFIGVGNRGTQLLTAFRAQSDCEVAALCDVYEPYVSRDFEKVDPRFVKMLGNKVPKMGEQFQSPVSRHTDYRKMLDDKSIDAVCIATPDHWHAIHTIDAIRAGKDTYIEKPVSKTVEEGRAMVRAARESSQVVATGLNRRAASLYRKLADEIPRGKVGKISFASACYVSNMYPAGIGKMKPENPPAGLNWDLWLGPRAYRPYQCNIAPYMFRWWEDYANQISNNGVHFLDLIRWLINEKAPVSVSAHGGRFVLDDDRTIPDTMQVTYEFASGVLVTMTIMEATSGSVVPYGYLEIRGTNGNLQAAENDYRIVPAAAGQFQVWDKKPEKEEFALTSDGQWLSDGSHRDSTYNNVRNFLDCVKSRKNPWADLEEGHRSTCMAHLGTIALMTRQRLEWNGETERFTNSDEANRLLSYEYRKPWKL